MVLHSLTAHSSSSTHARQPAHTEPDPGQLTYEYTAAVSIVFMHAFAHAA